MRNGWQFGELIGTIIIHIVNKVKALDLRYIVGLTLLVIVAITCFS